MEKALKHIFTLLLFVLLFLPMVQLTINLFEESPLQGIAETVEAPEFRWASWMEGTFQDTLGQYAAQHVGFHTTLVRLNNQYYYSFYNRALANHVIIGQDQYLYDRAHINAYTGADFLGEDTIRMRVMQIKELRDILTQKGIQLMVAFVPGKATGTPAHLPIGTPAPSNQTNYRSYKRLTDSVGVPNLDFIAWYREQEKTSPYTLYPSGGIHWSAYCAHLAADTLLGFIGRVTNRPMPRIDSTTIEVSPVPRFPDNDIDKGMNLLFPNKGSAMAYAKWKSTPVERTLSTMAVADSYYFKFFTDYSAGFFKKTSLWFYYNELHIGGENTPKRNHEVDILKQIESQDLIILYTADANLPKFSWGFAGDALRAYRDPVRRATEITRIKSELQADAALLSSLQQKAKTEGLPFDSVLTREAIYTLEHTRLK